MTIEQIYPVGTELSEATMKATALVVSLRHYAVGLIAATTLLLSNQAFSAVVSLGTGTVTYVEGTYMPTTIVFTLSSGDSLCPAGTPLYWISSNVDNMKAVYSTLLANMVSARQIYAHYDSTTVGSGVPAGACRVWFIGSR